MTAYDLDLLRRQATETDARGNPLPCDPRLILHLLDSIRTLMDEDSILAAGQRTAKGAVDAMVEARKERDQALAQRDAMSVTFARQQEGLESLLKGLESLCPKGRAPVVVNGRDIIRVLRAVLYDETTGGTRVS